MHAGKPARPWHTPRRSEGGAPGNAGGRPRSTGKARPEASAQRKGFDTAPEYSLRAKATRSAVDTVAPPARTDSAVPLQPRGAKGLAISTGAPEPVPVRDGNVTGMVMPRSQDPAVSL